MPVGTSSTAVRGPSAPEGTSSLVTMPTAYLALDRIRATAPPILQAAVDRPGERSNLDVVAVSPVYEAEARASKSRKQRVEPLDEWALVPLFAELHDRAPKGKFEDETSRKVRVVAGRED